MFGIDTSTAVSTPPAISTAGTAGWFTNGNAATGEAGTVVDADWLNGVQGSLLNLLTTTAITPVKGDFTQITAAVEALARAAAGNISQWQLVSTSGSLTVPSWATRVELRAIGGGGAGAATDQILPTAGNFSGGGGGAGGDAWGVYAVAPADTLVVTIGAGASTSGAAGGSTSVSYNGNTLLSAAGGYGGVFQKTQYSSGAYGGAATGGTVWNQTGAWGSDGQWGDYPFTGNGGSGPFGGAGRAGAGGGESASHYGAGGGGSYGSSAAGVSSPGGNGYQGCLLYRFLP